MDFPPIGWAARARQVARLGLAAFLWLMPAAAGADRLDWRVKENSVDAQIEGWPLHRLLENISAKTRWQIYVEPDVQRSVSAKFKDLKPGEALRRLLGDLNFALLPSANGPSRLYIFRNSQAGATQLVAAPREGTGGGGAIRNELIVTLKPGATTSIDDLAKRLGAQVVGRLDAQHAYRLRFDSDEAATAGRAALTENADVDSTETNYAIPRPELPEALAAGGVTPFTLRPRAVADNGQIVVGLIDTPIQTEGTVLKDFLLPGISVAGKSELPPDQLTHATGMGEIILYAQMHSPDAAKGSAVRLLPVDVYGDAGSTTTFEIARGIYEAINGGASIVNLSLGGDSDSPLVRNLISSGHAQGVIFVGAAGNEPVTTATYPAAYPEVIAVTATGRNGDLASYANRGDFVDLAATGSSVVPFQGRAYLMVGTSTAAANVTGLAAALANSSGKRGADLEAQIRQPATPKPGSGGK